MERHSITTSSTVASCHTNYCLIQNGNVVEDKWSVQAKDLLLSFVKKINLPIRFVRQPFPLKTHRNLVIVRLTIEASGTQRKSIGTRNLTVKGSIPCWGFRLFSMSHSWDITISSFVTVCFHFTLTSCLYFCWPCLPFFQH